MPCSSSLRIGRQKIRNREGTSTKLCLFCRIARNQLQFDDSPQTRRNSSTFSGSRGLHGGTPAKRPPPEGATSNTNRPSWPAAAPNYDNSALSSFLRSRREANPSINKPGGALNILRPPPASELGKWAKTGLLTSSYPTLQPTPTKPSNVINERGRPIPNSASALPSRESHGLSREVQNNQRDELSRRTIVSNQTPSHNTANQVASRSTDAQHAYPFPKKSAIDIEKDLFAGISSEAPKPDKPTPRSPAMVDSIVSNLGREIRANPTSSRNAILSNFATSHSKLVQPLRLAPETIEKTLNHIQRSERQPPPSPEGFVSGVPMKQFGFLSASARPAAGATPGPQTTTEGSLSANPETRRVGGTGWISSSRESWDTEVKDGVEQAVESEPEMFKQSLEELLSSEQLRKHKRKELEMLKKRAKSARFKLSIKDIAHWQPEAQKVEAPVDNTTSNTLYIPPSISVVNFSNLLKVPLGTLQRKMALLGLEEEECQFDHLLNDEMASLIALEFGFEPHVDKTAAFDLFPQPPPGDKSSSPLRPPIVTIMGHVDHGKTTLLDTLRKSSVAASEAGGITQHIGAFSVKLSSGEQITFLDTPGHAAFLSMRERGANVTDIIVLVVAADDGIMPQTIEAIEHARKANVPIIVAINKCDREDADPESVKTMLLAHELELEEFGGEVQCVEVSGLTGEGLDNLETSITTLAEVLEVRAPVDGMAEGWIIESATDAGRGINATVLVKRGTLRVGDIIVAGTTYAKVRRMTTSSRENVRKAFPGTAVEITGWKERPAAGDVVLQADNESNAKLAIRNRITKQEAQRDQEDIDAVNASRISARRERWLEREKKLIAEENARNGQSLPGIIKKGEDAGPKKLRLLIKADVSGSAEAVEEAVKDLGNNEVGIQIVDTTVGEINEGDILMASAANASILAFNLRALNPSLRSQCAADNIEILHHSIIYKLIDDINSRLESMLAPRIEITVTGEGEVSQIFDITVKGKGKTHIAGAKVTNGSISIKEMCRITRNGKIVFSGNLHTLKHFKDDVTEVRKGTECGLAFEGYEDLKVGDIVQSYKEIVVKRKLYA